jgi:hypothetical protein
MGGMFTILKIREGLRSYDEEPGWYEHPEGTVATPAGERQAAAPARSLPVRPPGPGSSGSRTFDAVRGGSHGGSSHRR